MLPMEDRDLLRSALTSLSVEDQVIEEIFKVLDSSTTSLAATPVPTIEPSWFGGSFTGGVRLGTNASMAQEAVEEEMAKLIETLRDYRQNLEIFRDDVYDTDATVATTIARIQSASERVDPIRFGEGPATLPPATEGSR